MAAKGWSINTLLLTSALCFVVDSSELPKLNCSVIATSLNDHNSSNGIAEVTGCYDFKLRNVSTSVFNTSLLVNLTHMMEVYKAQTGSWDYCRVSVTLMGFNSSVGGLVAITGSNVPYPWCSVDIHIEDSVFPESRFGLIGVDFVSNRHTHVTLNVTNTNMYTRNTTLYSSTSKALLFFIQGLSPTWSDFEIGGMAPFGILGYSNFSGPNTNIVLDRVTLACENKVSQPVFALAAYCSGMTLGLGSAISFDAGARFLLRESTLTGYSNYQYLFPAGLASIQSSLLLTRGASLVFDRSTISGTSAGLCNVTGGVVFQPNRPGGSTSARRFELSDGSTMAIVNCTITAASTDAPCSAFSVIAERSTIDIRGSSHLYVAGTAMTVAGRGASNLAAGFSLMADRGSLLVRDRSWVRLHNCTIQSTSVNSVPAAVVLRGQEGAMAEVSDQSDITFDRVSMVSAGVGPTTGIVVEFIKAGTRFDVLRQSAITVVNCTMTVQSAASAGSVPQGPAGIRFNVYDNATLRVANSSTISIERSIITATATSGGTAPLARGVVFLTYSAQFLIEGGSSVLISQTTVTATSTAASPAVTAAYGVHIEGYLPTAQFALRAGSTFVIDSCAIATSAKVVAYSFIMNTTLAPNPTFDAACSFAMSRTVSTAAIAVPQTTVGALRFATGPGRHISVKGVNANNASQVRAAAIVLDRIDSTVSAMSNPVANRPIADFSGSVAPIYVDIGTPQQFVFANCIRQNSATVATPTDPVLSGGTAFTIGTIAAISSAQCSFPDTSVATGSLAPRASAFNMSVCQNTAAFQFGCGFGAYGGWNSIFNGSTRTQFVVLPAPQCECTCTNQAIAAESPVDNAIECVVRGKVPEFNISDIGVERIVVDSIKPFVSPSWSRSESRSATLTTSQSSSRSTTSSGTRSPSAASGTPSSSVSPGSPTLPSTRSATASMATMSATSSFSYYRAPSPTTVASATRSRSGDSRSNSATESAATPSAATPSSSRTANRSVSDTASRSKGTRSAPPSLSLQPVVTPTRSRTATPSPQPTRSSSRSPPHTPSAPKTRSASGSLQIPPTPTTIVVTPTISPTAMRSTSRSRSRAPTVTAPVPPTPAPTPPPTLESVPEDVVEATETTVGSTAAASGALASPGAAMQASRALAVLALASCDFRHDRPVAFPGTMWPKFAVGEKRVGGYYRGAVVSCFLSTLGFLGVCVIAGSAFKFHKRRSLGEVLSKLRFPGTLVFIVGFVQDGLVSNAVSTLRHAEATGTDIALLGFILFLFLFYVYAVTKICMSLSMATCSIQRAPLGLLAAPVTLCGGRSRRHGDDGEGDADTTKHLSKAERKKLKATLNFRLKRFMIGERLWLPRKLNKGDEDRLAALKALVPDDLPHDSPQAKRLRQRERAITRGQDVFTNKEALKSCGFIFKKYHRNARFFYTFDLLAAGAVSVLKGIRPATHSGCVGVMVGVFIVTTLFAILALVTRPYLIAAKNFLLVLASVLTAFAALMVLGGTAAESGKMLLVGQGAAATSGYITIGSLAVSLYRRAALTHYERTMARKREKEFDDGKAQHTDSDSLAGDDAAEMHQVPLLGATAQSEAAKDCSSSAESAVAAPTADGNGPEDTNRVDFELDYFLGPSRPRDTDENAIVTTLDDLRVVDPFVYNLALKAPSESQRDFILSTARTHQGRQFARTMESVVTDHITRNPAMPTRAQEFYAEPPSTSWPVRCDDGTYRGPL